MSERFEADQVQHDRWLELGLFVAWHIAVFNRNKQKPLPSLPSVMAKFRTSRKKGEPFQDWRLEREQMAAIRERMSKKDKPK